MSYLRVAGCHKRPSAHHSDLSACNLVLSSPVAVAGRVMTAGSGFEACFCWREGGHCIHCMHCALQFLPDGLHTARQKRLADWKANRFPTLAMIPVQKLA